MNIHLKRQREKYTSHLTVRINYTHPGIKHLSNTYRTGLLKENCLFIVPVEVKSAIEIYNPISI
jgi:hypothetical protein